MKNRGYHKQAIKRHYGGALRGLAHNQLFAQRGLRGTTLGPGNRGRRLDAAERQAIEQKMRDEGRLEKSARDLFAAKLGAEVAVSNKELGMDILGSGVVSDQSGATFDRQV